jgi:IS5 family transposase
MERQLAEPTFADAMIADLGGPRTGEFPDRCEQLIPWAKLADSIKDFFPEQPLGGRPFWPAVVMLKCVMLQKWYGLSDPGLEEQLRDRISFRRFVKLSLEEATPDETTMVKFRDRLRDHGCASTIFESALDSLRARGLVLKEGSIVDATIVDAPQGRKVKELDGTERHTHDRCAKRVRGQKELSAEQKIHNTTCSQVRAFVEHPRAWMVKMGYTAVRYRGLVRNALDFALTTVAYNFKRSFSLLGRPLSRSRPNRPDRLSLAVRRELLSCG